MVSPISRTPCSMRDAWATASPDSAARPSWIRFLAWRGSRKATEVPGRGASRLVKPEAVDSAVWPEGAAASRRRPFRPRGKDRESRRLQVLRHCERELRSIPRRGAARQSPEKPAIHDGEAVVLRDRPAQAGTRSAGRRFHPPPPQSAIGLGAVGRRVAAPTRRSAGTTRPRLSRASPRGRSRLPQSRAANARRAVVLSATRPSRGGGDGGTRRHRRRCGRRRAPMLRLRPVPRARRRSARRVGTRLWRSARSAFCRRAQGPACSSRPGCIRGP